MSKASTSTAFCLLSVVLFGVGAVLAISSLVRYPATERKLAKAITASERLDTLEQAFLGLDALLEPFASLRYDALDDPRELVTRAFGADRIEDVRLNEDACDAGYVVNQIEVSLQDVAFESLLPFVRTAEALRPPLRLTSCAIHASATQAGTGNVILKLERIERKTD
jgi:hypothetical protein